MKFIITVDSTPEEARAFLGLPDLRPIQEAFVAQLRERLTTNLATLDADALLRSWITFGVPGLESVTKAMRSQIDIALGREPRS
ncbi:MAG: DUF6489 family protein [Rhodospirillaceae bacterium]